MLINSQTLKDLFVGFRSDFNTGFRSVEPQWNQIATLVPSMTAENLYGWLGKFPRLREWVGDRVLHKMAAEAYRLENKKFESSIEVKRDDIEDDQFGVYSPMMQEMGFAAATHPDELVFEAVVAAFTTGLCYDGQPFFDSDHPVGDGTVSNVQSGSGAPWVLLDLRRPLKPFIFQRRKDYNLVSMTRGDDESVFMRDTYRYGVDGRGAAGYGFWQLAYASENDLSAANFKTARSNMKSFKSDEGRPLSVRPTHILVGPSRLDEAETLFNTQTNAAGAGNTLYQAVQIIETPWLD
jgi:phage major head subunit gpT-like protein